MLHVIATPIGNFKDLSPRAAEALKDCDYVICEETRQALPLLKKLGLDKPCLPLNEHNESKVEHEYLALVGQGKKLALISDCGTPLVCDPGRRLLESAHLAKVEVSPVPGACSAVAALSVCGFDAHRFLFAGFPSRDKTERRKELERWNGLRLPVVLMDAPFRRRPLLEGAIKAFGKFRRACLCLNLTQPGETVLWGGLEEISRNAAAFSKRPFVLIVDS